MNPLDWAAIGAGVLALIFSFFAYYSYHATSVEARTECARPSAVPSLARGLLTDLCGGTTVGAWHGFFGWFGVLLGLVAAGIVAFAALVTRMTPPAQTRVVALGAAGLGLLSTLIALVVVPDWPALRALAAEYGGSYTGSQYSKNVADGHGFSYWIVLIMLIVLTVATFLRLQQTGGSVAASMRGTRRAGPPADGPPAGYGAPQGTWPGALPASEAPPGYGQPPAPPAAPQQRQPSAPWGTPPPHTADARRGHDPELL